MRILLLADLQSSHTIKWAFSLAELGINICIFGLTPEKTIYRKHPRICVRSLEANQSIVRNKIGAPSKLIYLRALPQVRKLIHTFQPDIVHAHFASSYGLLGALSSFHPFILSVWGSDIFEFPQKSLLHRLLIRFNLARADRILSTSHFMASEVSKHTKKNVEVTPFGIDISTFKSQKVSNIFTENDVVIGTIKALEPKYGVEYLIRAFHVLKHKYDTLPLKLLIVGQGSQEKALKHLVEDLSLENHTVFTGHIPFADISRYHNMLSIFVAVSTGNESFGVAVIEASACGKPVVVSDIGGLPEVVNNGVTGFIVPPRDYIATAEAIEKLIVDPAFREKIGNAGRKWVVQNYNWRSNISQMLNIYRLVISRHKNL